jgi:hypothetical protein
VAGSQLEYATDKTRSLVSNSRETNDSPALKITLPWGAREDGLASVFNAFEFSYYVDDY